MKRNKLEVTIGGFWKLLIFLALIIATIIFFDPSQDANLPAFISMFVYSLLFVFLGVYGSNSRIAAWFTERKFFTTIFFMPTIICAFYSGIYFALADESNAILAAFAVLLTIFSIPFTFILARVQGGIRRGNALTAFLLFPVIIYGACYFFAQTAFLVALGAAAVTVVICIIISVVEFGRDHKVDYASEGDKATNGDYTARWDGYPMSDVSDNVIHIKGTIIIEYKGDLYEDYAKGAAENLIQSYVYKVGRDMPGYTVDKASVELRYVNKD